MMSLLATFFLCCILSPVAHGDSPTTFNSPATTDQPTPTEMPEIEIAVADNRPGVDEGEEFQGAIQQMALALFSHIGDPDPVNGDLGSGNIAVSSFVDLKQLTRTSSFGRYLSEQLSTEFQQQGYRVVEIRKSTSITMQEKRGEYGLSRDVSEINPNVAARTLITGTYTLAGDHILVNAKVLDNKTAVLITSATMVFPRTKMANQLLADSISVAPRKQQVSSTKIKRLKL